MSLYDEKGKKRLYVEELPEIRVASVIEAQSHSNLNKTNTQLKTPKPQFTSLSPKANRAGVTFNGIVRGNKTNAKNSVPARR